MNAPVMKCPGGHVLQQYRVGSGLQKCKCCEQWHEEGEFGLHCDWCLYYICLACVTTEKWIQSVLCRHPRGLLPKTLTDNEEEECSLCEADILAGACLRVCTTCGTDVCSRCCAKLGIRAGTLGTSGAGTGKEQPVPGEGKRYLSAGCGHPQGLQPHKVEAEADVLCSTCLVQQGCGSQVLMCNACGAICSACLAALGVHAPFAQKPTLTAGVAANQRVASAKKQQLPALEDGAAAAKQGASSKNSEKQALSGFVQSSQSATSKTQTPSGPVAANQRPTTAKQQLPPGGMAADQRTGSAKKQQGPRITAAANHQAAAAMGVEADALSSKQPQPPAAGKKGKKGVDPSAGTSRELTGMTASSNYSLDVGAGSKLQVFWDMENCQMLTARLSPQQHFDLLISIFMGSLGILPTEFELHCCLSQDSQGKLPPAQQENLLRRNAYVHMHSPLGKSGKAAAGGKRKEDLHGLDVHMIDAMSRYVARASKGDILVLISGDGGYMDTLRKAVYEKGIKVLLLCPEGATDAELLGNRIIIKWQWWWRAFLDHHIPAVELPNVSNLQIQGPSKVKASKSAK